MVRAFGDRWAAMQCHEALRADPALPCLHDDPAPLAGYWLRERGDCTEVHFVTGRLAPTIALRILEDRACQALLRAGWQTYQATRTFGGRGIPEGPIVACPPSYRLTD